MLFPAVRGVDEDYATADELEEADTLPESDLRIPQWPVTKTINGARVRVPSLWRVRAFDLDTEIEIDQAATDKKTGLIDPIEQIVQTIHRGVIKPKLSLERVRKFRKKNGYVCVEIAQYIRRQGAMEPDAIDQYIREIAAISTPSSGADAPSDTEQTDDSTSPE